MFKIEKTIAVLSTSENGWEKALTKTSWYEKEAKLDIRTWNPDKSKPGKGGITLTKEEAIILRDALNELDL